MSTLNPYAAPQDPPLAAPPAPAGLRYARAFGIVAASGAVFGAGGALLGWLLGVAIPDYYRSVFRSGHDPDFDPVQVGLGLGLTQGVTVGLIVGCVVCLAVALSHRKRAA